ncbi:MAG: glycosyltransferase [Herbinix sp.]|nr:glycosyltransferase [Herbinix sp.]
MNTLVVIPARGNSKGIPRKNIRLMANNPLIYYVIQNAKQINCPSDIIVTTDDEEIISVVQGYGIECIKRPSELAGDRTTLDPVVNHAVETMEALRKYRYDIVITLQPTSPTLKSVTLNSAIEFFVNQNKDSLISVVNRPHLSWRRENDEIVPNYIKRLNRQELPCNYSETGGFFITKREFVTNSSRLGNKIGVFEVLENESIDIDSEADWIVCESMLNRKKIIFRVDGEEKLGMGHIYRCLTLAYKLIGHDLCFITKKQCDLGVRKLEQSFFPMKVIEQEEDMWSFLEEYKPDIIINDILNTSEEYMLKLRSYVKRIINFEDEGEGSNLADGVINALYDNKKGQKNVYSGFEYFCIRDEFIQTRPKEFETNLKNVIIMFGGSDPSNLTQRIYNICHQLHDKYPDIRFNFITGFGYPYKDNIKTKEEFNIFAYHDVKRVSKYMMEADLAITSQGRTIYELAYMGVPAIVLAQNQRETEHLFAQIKNGFINLGIGHEQDEKTILRTMEWLIDTPQLRKEMRNLMMSKEFQKGHERVLRIILDTRLE